MSLTEAQFRLWLDDDTKVHCILVEADYKVLADGSLGTEYLATTPFTSLPTDTPPNRAYLSRVQAIPGFAQQMSDAFVGRTTANIGKIVITAGDAYTDGWVFDRDWVGRGLRLYVGDPSWPKADFRSLSAGITADFRLDGTNNAMLVARDLQHALSQPLRTAAMATGPAAGRPAPLVWGPAFNVPCVLEDAATHKYRVNDGPVGAITAVRSNGQAVTYTADLFDGSFVYTGSNTPIGRLTADVTGASGGGTNTLNNASDIIRNLVTVRGYLTNDQLDSDSFNTLKTLCPQALAYFVPVGDVEIYKAVDEVTATIGAYTSMTRDGKLYVRRFDFSGAPVLTINAGDTINFGLSMTRVLQPVAQIRIGSKRNYSAGDNQATGGFGGATEDVVNSVVYHHQQVGWVTNPALGTYAKTRRLPNPHRPTPSINGNALLLPHVPPINSVHEDDGTLPSLFTNQSDANAEAARRMTLWGVPRYLFTLDCFASALRLNLGDAITLVHPRYRLSSGKTAVIYGLREMLSEKHVSLDLII